MLSPPPGTPIAEYNRETNHRILITYDRMGIQLQVEYMEPFVRAALRVLEDVSGGSDEPGPLKLVGNVFFTSSTNIAARISGSLSGDVIFSMSGETARRLAEMVSRAPAQGFGHLMGSGLSELGDRLGEQTRMLLCEHGHSCEVAGPTVFQGLNVEFYACAPALSVRIATGSGDVDVNVAVRNGTEN